MGSGSQGNALVVEAGGGDLPTRVLVDCGFSPREIEARLASEKLSAQDLNAILVTHEHGDHAGGVFRLARRHKIPVWLTHGTRVACAAKIPDDVALEQFDPHTPFSVGALEVMPYPVPHDAREPAQFVFSDGLTRLGLLTDVGETTPHIRSMLSGLDALILECNHDREMLAASPYHAALKRRIAGRLGHLANDLSAALLTDIDTSRLQHLVAAHLSAENNRPELAVQALARAMSCAEDWISVATQATPLGWRDIKVPA